MKAMKTTIRPMGNAHGVIIPKPLLAQLGIKNEVEMTVEQGALVLRKPASPARTGWAEAAHKIAAASADRLVLPELTNEDDVPLTW